MECKERLKNNNTPSMNNHNINMSSRKEYLKKIIRPPYLKAKSSHNKKEKSRLLNEAEKVTGLNRKYLMEKLKSKSNLDKLASEKKKRKRYYDNSLKPVLVSLWRIFDYPCGQRLKTSIEQELEKLMGLKEISCSQTMKNKLKKISSSTIDRKLKHQKEVERIRRKYKRKISPLLYKKIPVKVFEEQNRTIVGNVQVDLVEHCGSSSAGEFINTLSSVDIMSGWWEGEAVLGKGQIPVQESMERIRKRCSFPWKGIHSDNGKEFINAHLFDYTERKGLDFSRSRPYKKNDNCLVEQKNWTHVKKFIGYSRYDSKKELSILNDLYRNELRLYKNFFQPTIKLVLKERVGSKVHRKYDEPKTPYRRLIESKEVSEKKKKELKEIYQSLNVAKLKRTIDKKLDKLSKINQKVDIDKKVSVRFQTGKKKSVSVR